MINKKYNIKSSWLSLLKIDFSEINDRHMLYGNTIDNRILHLSKFYNKGCTSKEKKEVKREIDLLLASKRLMYEYSLLEIYKELENNLDIIVNGLYTSHLLRFESIQSFILSNIDDFHSLKTYKYYRILIKSLDYISRPNTYSNLMYKPYYVNNNRAIQILDSTYVEISDGLNLFIFDFFELVINKCFELIDDEIKKILSSHLLRKSKGFEGLSINMKQCN